MMPLWMRASLSPSARCGWALPSVGPPWVAQRVCPMPVVPSGIGDDSSLVDQGLELAGLLGRHEVPCWVDDGDARRVVAAVLEATEATEEDVLAAVAADVADDSTHGTDPTVCLDADPAKSQGWG